MVGDYLGSAWQFVDTVKCYLSENCLMYTNGEGLPIFLHRNGTYLSNHQPESAKSGFN